MQRAHVSPRKKRLRWRIQLTLGIASLAAAAGIALLETRLEPSPEAFALFPALLGVYLLASAYLRFRHERLET